MTSSEASLRLERSSVRPAVAGLLLLGAVSIGMGTAVHDGAYSFRCFVLAALGSLLAVTASLVPKWLPSWSGWSTAALAVTLCGVAAIVYPAGIYGSGAMLSASRACTLAAAFVASTLLLLTPRLGRLAFWSVMTLGTAAGVTMIQASQRPAIDVWYMLQAASAGLTRGENFYTLHWSSGISGEIANQFTYLPGSALVLAPFDWMFGDVRYGLVVMVGLFCLLASELAGKARMRWLVGGLLLVYPRATFGIEQAWSDPLLLVALAAMVLAVLRSRKGWAVVALAVLLSAKQYPWLLVPLAAWWRDFGWRRTLASVSMAGVSFLPWLIANPRAFWHGVTFALGIGPRPDSLSLVGYLLAHHRSSGYALVLVAVLLAYAFVGKTLPRDAFGFAVGSALVIIAFNLADKETFYNEWEFAAGLLILAAAVVSGVERSGQALTLSI